VLKGFYIILHCKIANSRVCTSLQVPSSGSLRLHSGPAALFLQRAVLRGLLGLCWVLSTRDTRRVRAQLDLTPPNSVYDIIYALESGLEVEALCKACIVRLDWWYTMLVTYI